MAKFPLGQTMATPGALKALEAVGQSVQTFLARHGSSDWGDLCAEDREMNEDALCHGGRLFSAYILPGGEKIWVITEADRSVTTLLLPDEY